MNLKDEIIIAIAKGRILEEGMKLLNQIGIRTKESMQDSRKLIYDTNYNSGEATNFIVINLMELNNKIDLEQFNIIDNFQDCYYLTSK